MIFFYINSCIKYFFFVISIYENLCYKGNIGSWNIKIYRNMMIWIVINVLVIYINEWMYEKFGYLFFFIIIEVYVICIWKK